MESFGEEDSFDMADISDWPIHKLIELYEIIDELNSWGLVVTDDELLKIALGLEPEDILNSQNSTDLASSSPKHPTEAPLPGSILGDTLDSVEPENRDGNIHADGYKDVSMGDNTRVQSVDEDEEKGY